MMMIYAFRDRHGHWHGDPDADTLEEPGSGTLTYCPPPGSEEYANPFAQQTLQVRYAATDLEPGPVSYQLDDGGTFPASWQVCELLSAPYAQNTAAHTRSAARPAPAAPQAAGPSSLRTQFHEAGRRYSLVGEPAGDGRLDVSVVISGAGGEIHGELSGEVDSGDLSCLGRLFAAAGVACPFPVGSLSAPTRPAPCVPSASAVRPGSAWSPEAKQLLATRRRAGADFEQLAAEFGRSVKAIRFQLWQLKIDDFPDDLVPDQRTPQAPKPPKAYSLDDLRQEHPNSHKRWEPEDEQLLAQRCAEGASLQELSDEFGRNLGSIRSRLIKIDAEGPAADEARRLL